MCVESVVVSIGLVWVLECVWIGCGDGLDHRRFVAVCGTFFPAFFFFFLIVGTGEDVDGTSDKGKRLVGLRSKSVNTGTPVVPPRTGVESPRDSSSLVSPTRSPRSPRLGARSSAADSLPPPTSPTAVQRSSTSQRGTRVDIRGAVGGTSSTGLSAPRTSGPLARVTGLKRPTMPSEARRPTLPSGAGRGSLAEWTQQEVQFPEAIQILRHLESSDVRRLAVTCRMWAQVCKDYLSEWRRIRLVLELVATERTYLMNMRSIIESYVIPKQVGTLFMDDQEAFQLFANVEELYELHSTLYRSMAETTREWSMQTTICHVFLDHFTNAVSVYAVYSRGQTDALLFAEQLRNELRIPDDEWRVLESFLIQPIQRVPRYQMLLREIAANTRKDHDEQPILANALALLSKVGQGMQRQMELASYGSYVANMAANIQDLPATSDAKASRCAELKWMKDDSKKEKDTFVILYPKRLYICLVSRARPSKGKNNDGGASNSGGGAASVAMPLGVHMEAHTKHWKVSVELELARGASKVAAGRGILDGKPVSTFIVISAGGESYTFLGGSPAECSAWIESINDAM